MKWSQVESSVTQFLAASSTNAELVRSFTAELRSESDRLIRRSGAYSSVFLLLAALFLLIVAGGVDQFTLLGVTITQLDAIAIMIPPAMAVLFALIMSITNSVTVLGSVQSQINEQAYPGLHKSGLDDLVKRTDMPFVEEPSSFWSGSGAHRLTSALSLTFFCIIFIGVPLAFFVYAYVTLVQLHRFGNVWVWLSLAVVLSLLILAVSMVLAPVWEPESESDGSGSDRPRPQDAERSESVAAPDQALDE
ncbi:MAG TPA: hypothetical protein VF635_13820 [Propionibacteriaceae bacterium]|jgi:hypothetical protein